MADEIKQVLGIDAAQALDTLKKLDQGYLSFQNRINAVATSLDNHNKKAGKTVSALKQIESAANSAAKALGKLDGAQSRASSGGGGTSSPGRSTGGRQKPLTGVDAENAFNKLLGQPLVRTKQQVESSANSVVQKMGEIRNAAFKNLRDVDKQVQNVTISWETFSRVVATQFIVRALSQLRDLFREAVGEAVEFQKQVALISTIAPDASIAQISAEVRRLSDSFNIPLLETAAGVYQALSNQVGDFGDSVRFTEEAAKFARATNSSLADSVDLLSGAIRSYGLTVNDTGNIAGIFFTAIDKGRITADQLANSFGRVGPAANEIGISLEELSAAMATITDKGVATSEGLTQFRGVITALTKPTVAMREQLAELGFSSSEAAIDTLGLAGILDALAEGTDGSAQAFAKLFPNVRGVGGALSLTGDNLKTFAANIREAQRNGEDFANSKFAEATATNAERVTKEINKIKNALTVDFGQAVLQATSDFLELSGGADGVVKAIQVLTPTAISATAAIATVAVAVGSLKVALLAASGPIGIVTAGLAALALAVPAALAKIDQVRTANAFRGVEELELANEKELEAFRKTGNDKLRAAKEADKQLVASTKERIQQINAEYLKDVQAAKSLNASLVANTERSLARIVNARQQFAQELQNAITNSQEAVRESENRIADIRDREESRKFNLDLRDDSDSTRFFKLTQRSAELARKAEEQLSEAFRTGNNDLRQRALRQFEAANSAANEADAIAQRTNNRVLEGRAARTLEDLARKQITAEERINELQLQRQKALDAERDKQEKIVQRMKELAKVALDNTSFFDNNGRQLTDDELAKQAQARQAATRELISLSFSAKDVKAADVLGLAQFVQSMENDLQRRPLKLAFDVESDIARIQDAMRKALSNIDVQLPFLKELEEAVGRSLRGTPDAIRQAIVEVQTELANLRQQQFSQDTLDKEVEGQTAAAQKVLDNLKSLQANAQNLPGSLKPASDAVDTTVFELERMLQTGDISVARLREIATDLGQIEFGSRFSQLGSQVKLAADEILRLSALSKTIEERQAQEPVDQGRIIQLEQILQGISQSSISGQFQVAQASISASVQPLNTIKLDAELAATAAERMAAAYERAGTVSLPAIPQFGAATAKDGRHVLDPKYMAAGGFTPRGMDTVPVMAREGETIINPDSSRKFFSQLQAINSGRQPIFRSEGGGTTVGDINITVQGGDSAEATVRSIGKGLRREIRRNSFRF